MKTKLIALSIVAFAFTACDKNDDPIPAPAVIPTGSWKLVELHHYDKSGKDSAKTTLPSTSTLAIGFDKTKSRAAFEGKPGMVTIKGGYKLEGDYKLKVDSIISNNPALTDLDIKTFDFLNAGFKYEVKKDTVIIYAKNKGFMLYSPVK